MMSGEIEPDLIIEPIPDELEHTIHIYNKIGSSSYAEIAAYQSVTGAKLKMYEIECLKAIDSARS